MNVYDLYFFLKRQQKKNRENKKENNRLVQKAIDRIEWYFNIVIRKWYENHPSEESGTNTEERKEKVVVSLTSFPKRIETIWLTIETILRQTIKADQIILWLAESQFPEGIEGLPSNLTSLQKRGLTIRFCDDLKSHKKYYYTMQEFPDNLVVLMDDDMFYPSDTIEKLLELHEKYPEDVCTISAQVMEGEKPSVWRNPRLKEVFRHSQKIQVFTGSGSLFPPGSVNEQAFNKNLIEELCPYADDLWLAYMVLKNNRYVTCYHPWRAFPITIYGTAQGSLYYINAEQGKNDEQWIKINSYQFDEVKL